jgi:DNA polymerase-3 subunit gamma/tau
VSAAPGEPTLAEQGNAADTARRNVAADHPLVRAILAAFPGARLESVHDAKTDRYGLPTEVPMGAPDMPDFAPLDAELLDDSTSPWELDA